MPRRRPLLVPAALAAAALACPPAARAQAPIQVLQDVVPGAGGSDPRQFVTLNGSVIFPATHPQYGLELWRTDGTAAGTQLLADLLPGTPTSSPQWLTVFQGRVWFSAVVDVQNYGAELCVSDGTAAGTQLFVDVRPGLGSSAPSRLCAHGEHLFFNAALGPVTAATYATDGTVAGTVQIGPRSDTEYVPCGSRVFFGGFSQGQSGGELWVSDGTPNGTQLVKDILPGASSSGIAWITALDDHRVVFAADDGVHGKELWVSDGTAAGTSLLADIRPGSLESGIASITAMSGRVWFVADDGTHGSEPWVSDGTPAGTQLLVDLNPGAGSSTTAYGALPRFPVLDGFFLFNALAPQHGLWRCDGTAAGITFVSRGAIGGDWARAGKRIWYAGEPQGGEREPWVSDGTPAGTYQLADLNTKTHSSPSHFTFALGRMFFTALHASVGAEPTIGFPGAAAQPFASGCGYGSRVPTLAATDPVLGGPLRFDGANAHPGAIGAVCLGLRPGNPLSLLGCTFWFDPIGALALPSFTVPATGAWTRTIPVPPDAALQHGVVVGQGLFLQTPGLLETTNPVWLTLGY